MSHTPGPWSYERDTFDMEEGPVWCIEDVAGTNLVLAKVFIDNPNSEDDARLITAAPDLLVACEIALNEHQNFCLTLNNCPLTNRLSAAIAKARGESS